MFTFVCNRSRLKVKKSVNTVKGAHVHVSDISEFPANVLDKLRAISESIKDNIQVEKDLDNKLESLKSRWKI